MVRPRVDPGHRFWSRVDQSNLDGCWLWTGPASHDGYGRFHLEPDRKVGAHKAAYILTYGEPFYHILHRCDNKMCCRPDHLYDGDHSDNMRDRATRTWRPPKRTVLAVSIAILVAAVLLHPAVPAHAHGDAPEDIDIIMHRAAEYRGASYWLMYRILRCESGGWDRRVINGTKLGRAGERGLAQILPRYGLGPLFESRGGDYSASDSIYFLAWATTHGLRHHWSC